MWIFPLLSSSVAVTSIKTSEALNLTIYNQIEFNFGVIYEFLNGWNWNSRFGAFRSAKFDPKEIALEIVTTFWTC